MVEIGSKIRTDFSLKFVVNGEEKEMTFSDILDRPTVVSVYMKNNTGSCDKQTLSLAEVSDWFDGQGYHVLAISKDTCGSHKRYADKQGINYVLASDPDYKFAEATDSVVEKSMYGKTFVGPSRSAFVIGTDGTILGVIEKVTPKEHAAELKELIEGI